MKLMTDEMEEMIFNYVKSTWYDSRCADKNEIKRIIREEINKRPQYMDMKMSKLCLIIKRRCISEL